MARKRKNAENVKINGSKLKKLLQEAEISMSSIGVKAGYGASYMGNAIPRNSIAKPIVNYLELLGIHFEDYAPDPESVIAEPVTVDLAEFFDEGSQVKTDSIASLTPDQFSKLIYQAVYAAVCAAWKDA